MSLKFFPAVFFIEKSKCASLCCHVVNRALYCWCPRLSAIKGSKAWWLVYRCTTSLYKQKQNTCNPHTTGSSSSSATFFSALFKYLLSIAVGRIVFCHPIFAPELIRVQLYSRWLLLFFLELWRSFLDVVFLLPFCLLQKNPHRFFCCRFVFRFPLYYSSF